eukprot:gb/GFBE01011449.1/.p1 GENE.gb/GFBE01011449.1/~~gb/GFBE01011449.1/.p1  ORF type:complete len:142 (+),score=16.97 gb/GFBE01011449.1/:1-426(+)
MVNALVWGLWGVIGTQAEGGQYPWPLWVSFGSAILLVSHMLSMVPFLFCRRSRRCPRWVWIVLLNFTLVNLTCWIVYFFTTPDGYRWPLWVLASTSLSMLVVALAPTMCAYMFDTSEKPHEEELMNELAMASSSGSESEEN